MSKQEKIIAKVLSGTRDANIPFADLCQVLIHLDFEERIRGDHHIFTKEGVDDILNLQPYQVKQVREVILKYKLEGN